MINNKAFTLTEVLLVVVILGIIAGFAIPEYKKSVLKARERTIITHLKSLHGANFLYRSNHSNQFLPGHDLSLTDINNQLNINLIPQDGLYYEYHSYDPTKSFGVSVLDDSPSDPTDKFEVCIKDVPLSNLNPCCEFGNCPTLPPCTFVCYC